VRRGANKVSCNYCGSSEYDIVAEHTRFERNNILQCRNCGMVYLEIKKSKGEIESFYTSKYRKVPTLPVQSPEEAFYNEVAQHDANNRILFISNNISIQGCKILEIGSSCGNILEKLNEYGCGEAIGIELNEEYSTFARQRGLKVISQPIEELNFHEEFDAVVSFHTLEHMYDPMAVIKAAYMVLKPCGCFLGEVPNQNDWRIKIFNDEATKRFHYDPNHYYYYSPITLKNYLGACDFNNIRLETAERYNSLLQLRNIICSQNSAKNIGEILKRHIFPKTRNDEVRLPNLDNQTEMEFNRIFGKGVNSELMGNCLRWVAVK